MSKAAFFICATFWIKCQTYITSLMPRLNLGNLAEFLSMRLARVILLLNGNCFEELTLRAIWLFLKFLLLLIFVVVGAFFAMENSQTIGVSFILFSGPELSSGFWLLLFLAGGVALGILTSSLLIMSYRRKLSRANKKD